jgi:hypothetical protein
LVSKVTADQFHQVEEWAKSSDLIDLLPLSLQLDSKPFDVMKARPMFSPLFRREPIARRQIFLCGRQIGKTASAAGYCTMNTTWREGFRVLYVAPLQLYVTRFHHIYMAKMLRNWQMPWEIQDKHCVSNVAEKTFVTGSHFHGVSCFNSAGNAIGIPADAVVFDEVQDLNIDFLPQIIETLGTSMFAHELYFGTARGVENTIQKIFDRSSQSEFAVKCTACNYWNIPSKDQDALTMIQPHGIACARCSRLLNVEAGQWVHAYPDRVRDFVGWHVPQTIVKARIVPHDNYLEKIYNKLHGVRRYSLAKFYNEVLGISIEMGSSPISPQQIRDASVLEHNANVTFKMREYAAFGAGVDWGGSEQTSFTVATLIGWHRKGEFHVLNALRPTGVPENERHLPVAHFFAQNFRQQGGRLESIFADGEFVGRVQNKNLQQVGQVPVGSVHYGTLKTLFRAHPGNHFIVDRTTILYIVFSLIKARLLKFPKDPAFEIFTEDLKAVYIEEVDTPRGQIQRYQRYSTQADDFLHSVGYALLSCAVTLGIDLAEMVGLDPGGSLTKSYIDTIGEEMPILPYN